MQKLSNYLKNLAIDADRKREEFLASMSKKERSDFLLNEKLDSLEYRTRNRVSDYGNMEFVFVDKDRWDEFNDNY